MNLPALIPQGFCYPTERFPEFLSDLAPFKGEYASLRNFLEAVKNLSLSSIEELYTHTFDLNPPAPPYVGHYLFQAHELRSAFIVELKERMVRKGLNPSGELPDHIFWVLSYYFVSEPEERSVLWEEALKPALKKMLSALMDTDNPYQHYISFTLEYLSKREEGINV